MASDRVSIDAATGAAIVRVAGGTDLTIEVEAALGQGCTAVVLDFSGIEYFNSLAIASVITLRNRLMGAGGRLQLANLSPTLRSIFGILNLERLFSLDRDLPSALAALRA